MGILCFYIVEFLPKPATLRQQPCRTGETFARPTAFVANAERDNEHDNV